jgi:hypothetical protein
VGQVSSKLRREENGHSHWCPGCGEMHVVPDSWTFDGNLESPTFSPSVKITGQKTVVDERGEWTGAWMATDENGAPVERKVFLPTDTPVPYCCHYVLTAGVIQFGGDCTHAMVGQAVPLPDLPPHLRD